MHVIELLDTFPFAGTESHVFDLSSALLAAGVSVAIACPRQSALWSRATDAGIPLLHIAGESFPGLATVRTLAAELRSGRADIIHAHNGRTHLLAVAAMKRAGRGHVVATQHFLAPNRTGRRGPKAWLAARLHHWAEHNTAAFIAISNAVRDAMLTRHDAPAAKITVVHNGIVAAPAATKETEARKQKTEDDDSPSRCVGINSGHEGTKDAATKELEVRSEKLEDDGLPSRCVGINSEHEDTKDAAAEKKLEVRSQKLEEKGSEALQNNLVIEPGGEISRPTVSGQEPPIGIDHCSLLIEKPPNSSSSAAPLRVIFCAARLQKEKDIPTLIKAFALLQQQKLEVRSQKLEEKGSEALQGSSNSYLLTPNSSSSEALQGSSNSYLLTPNSSSSEAVQGSPNSQLLTPNSSSIAVALLIAGEGDQRPEIEKLIESMFKEPKETGTKKTEDDDSPRRHEDTKDAAAKETGTKKAEDRSQKAEDDDLATEDTEDTENTTTGDFYHQDTKAPRKPGGDFYHEGTREPGTKKTEARKQKTEDDDSPSRCVGINSEHEGTKDAAAKETEARKQKTEDDDSPRRHEGTKEAGTKKTEARKQKTEDDGLATEGTENTTNNPQIDTDSHRLTATTDLPSRCVGINSEHEGTKDAAEKKLEVRSEKLEESRSAGQPAGRKQKTASEAPPNSPNSYLLTPNSSHREAVRRNAVALLGFRRDVAALMAACDIFVLPAPAEPFGLVLLEAMAMGKPVIAANAGGPCEIVVHGQTGLLFEPGNPQSLAAAMADLLNNPDKAKAMGAAGRKRFEDHFTAARMAAQIAAIYGAAAAAQ